MTSNQDHQREGQGARTPVCPVCGRPVEMVPIYGVVHLHSDRVPCDVGDVDRDLDVAAPDAAALPEWCACSLDYVGTPDEQRTLNRACPVHGSAP